MANQYAGEETETFRDAWLKRILPVLSEDYEKLKATTPLRLQAKQGKKEGKAESAGEEVVHEKLSSAIADCHQHGERRNILLNLAWTAPGDNTPLQEHITLAKVAHMALDMFCDTSAIAPVAAPVTDEDPQEANPVCGTSSLATARGRTKNNWKIPAQVEKGFEIPIAITDATIVPELGNFKRLAMDVVVNAVWVALWWAKTEKNEHAESALKRLILEWPLDVVWIAATRQRHKPRISFYGP